MVSLGGRSLAPAFGPRWLGFLRSDVPPGGIDVVDESGFAKRHCVPIPG